MTTKRLDDLCEKLGPLFARVLREEIALAHSEGALAQRERDIHALCGGCREGVKSYQVDGDSRWYHVQFARNVGDTVCLAAALREQTSIVCPFCGEGDYDLKGLAMHLTGSGMMFAHEPCEGLAAALRDPTP